MSCNWIYRELKQAVAGEQLPAMVVDLDCLDENIERIAKVVEGFNKKLRVASKSVRVPWLLKYIIEKGGTHFRGVMCYSVAEAEFLFSQRIDNLLIAYPTASAMEIESFYRLSKKGANITLMADSNEHLLLIENVWKEHQDAGKAKVCIDVDMSWKPFAMHLGVHRSPIRSIDEFKNLYYRIQGSENIQFSGLMGYEAQVAGMGDKNPFTPLLNPIKRLIKKQSVKEIYSKRKQIAEFLKTEGCSPEIFNGGGTGSLQTSCKEPWLTEVTAGSGFLQSHLFDYYYHNKNVPAFCFALPITRKPQQRIVTCKSGGFVASGEVGADKWPVPFLPQGMKMVKNEGLGEVQTPVVLPSGMDMDYGDPLFFRPAKAGEIAERFTKYILIRKGKIVNTVPTYRGEGKCFY